MNVATSPPGSHGLLRFIACGSVAFSVDAAVLAGLSSGLGVPPIPACAVAIAWRM